MVCYTLVIAQVPMIKGQLNYHRDVVSLSPSYFLYNRRSLASRGSIPVLFFHVNTQEADLVVLILMCQLSEAWAGWFIQTSLSTWRGCGPHQHQAPGWSKALEIIIAARLLSGIFTKNTQAGAGMLKQYTVSWQIHASGLSWHQTSVALSAHKQMLVVLALCQSEPRRRHTLDHMRWHHWLRHEVMS